MLGQELSDKAASEFEGLRKDFTGKMLKEMVYTQDDSRICNHQVDVHGHQHMVPISILLSQVRQMTCSLFTLHRDQLLNPPFGANLQMSAEGNHAFAYHSETWRSIFKNQKSKHNSQKIDTRHERQEKGFTRRNTIGLRTCRAKKV